MSHNSVLRNFPWLTARQVAPRRPELRVCRDTRCFKQLVVQQLHEAIRVLFIDHERHVEVFARLRYL